MFSCNLVAHHLQHYPICADTIHFFIFILSISNKLSNKMLGHIYIYIHAASLHIYLATAAVKRTSSSSVP